MTIFFISDTHFGHHNIVTYCNRPYKDAEEMDQALVDNWNAVVQPMDRVYHLGDWAFHNYERIGQLKGIISTVPGNHDLERMKKLAPFLTEVLPELTYLKVDSVYRFVLCHYPLESWRREYRFHLHGHAHGDSIKRQWRFDVGVDATKLYRPISLEELAAQL